MNVSLTPELEQLVDQKMQTGRYATASDVIREGLQLLQWRDDASGKIAAGIASLRAGEGVDGEAFLARLEAELESDEPG